MGQTDEGSCAALAPGVRVRLCDPTLQPFYGVYGTVLTIRSCGGGRVEYVAVQMDDLPPNEGPALFYPHQVAVVTEEP